MKHQNVKDLVLKLRQQFNELQVNIPDELKAIKAWLVWETTEIQPNGKFDKIPAYPTTGRRRNGVQGSQEDLANLGTWADAVAAMENPKFAGVGFACLPCFGIVALDLDHCIKDDVRDPKWDWVLEATYCEVSPSGTGLRAFWTGVARQGKNHKAGVELFHSNGFVTVTGDYYDGGVVSPLSDSLRTRLEQLSQPQGSTQSEGMVLSKAQFQGGDRLALNAEHDERLSAIKQAGLYERDMGGGKHSIRCPFEEDHSDWGRSGGDGDTVYFQPYTNGYSEGWINCYHTHGNDQAAYWQKIGYNPMNVGVVTDPNFWEEPQPLIAKVENDAYPIHALPEFIKLAVEEVAGFTQSPISMLACSAITAISLALQGHYNVRRAEKLVAPLALYFLIIAESGERKTAGDKSLTQGIQDFVNEQMELAKPELQKYRADLQIWEAKHSGIKAKIHQLTRDRKQTTTEEHSLYNLEVSKPQPPKIPKLLLKDISPEKLGLSLAVDWPVAGIVTSEAGVFFGSHAMSKDVVMRTLSLLNILWDGGPISSERKVTEGFNIRSARLTMGLAIQEGTLREAFIRTGPLLRDTGFLARNLLCWPASNMGNRPFKEAPKKWPHLEAFNARIRAILSTPLPMNNGVLEPVEIGLSDSAKQDWVEYHDAVELQLKASGDYFEIKDVAAKSADNVARLAGLFEKFNPNGGTSISQDSLQRAAQICAWHLEEARRFFGELVLPQDLSDAVRLEKWLIIYSMDKENVSQRDAQHAGPVRDKKRLNVALAELESLNRIKLFQEGRRKLIKVNPMVMQ
jgi:hypothetical protein